MSSVFDAAQYVLRLFGGDKKLPITTWKLHKLVYYSQAWAVVWDDEPIFDESIEAWANGPVCPALYAAHRGQFKIDGLPQGDPRHLSRTHRDTIDVVYDHYGKKSSQYLSELSHQEKPWKNARKGLAPGDRGNRTITLDAMAEYYGGLVK